ncbi:MAG: hypothetical protein ROO71_02725 [Balneola sp.]
MGLIEATNDTVHHYPEVVVGYVSEGRFNDEREITSDIPNLFNPSLWTQTVRTFKSFGLSFKGEENAIVRIKGPASNSQENVVILTKKSSGLYGDVNSEIKLRPGEKYTLEIELFDGRKYQKETIIPKSTEIEIPDSIDLNIEFVPYQDGTPREESNPNKFYIFEYPEGNFLTEIQSNADTDRETLLLEDWEDFLFQDRGNYLRLGSMYALTIPSWDNDELRRAWIQDLSKNREKIWESKTQWMRFSFFSKDIGNNWQHMNEIFSSKGILWDEMYDRFIRAFTSRDSTYLFQVSTIEKVGENGEILPKSENDAIGFFAGYFSVYKKTVLIPVRNFDLDSVLSVHGY